MLQKVAQHPGKGSSSCPLAGGPFSPPYRGENFYASTGTGFLTTMTTMSRLIMDLVGPA